MPPPNLIRRSITTGTLLGAACPGLLLAREQSLLPTPSQTEGPFYPVHLFDSERDLDGDLLVRSGRRYTKGEVAWVSGTVRDTRGAPVAGAIVEIWQCDHDGHYHHPRDRGTADPDFQGFGRVETAADGSYRFRTLRPMPYPGRTPHIHFKVRQGDATLLTTQMYIDGEPGNLRDGLWRSLDPAQRAALTRPFVAGADGVRATFPIVIA